MQEIWRNIEGYEGLYQISNFGRVKSLRFGKEKIMKERTINCYFAVNLHKDGKKKSYLVHRLVASAFLPNPNNLPQVNHIDEVKTNNRVDNLEWCSAKYNVNYGFRMQRFIESNTNNPKISKKVLCIETGKIYPSVRQVERELGFYQTNISAACRGKYKTSYGFHWRYIN